MFLQSPINNCLVKIERRYQDQQGCVKIDPTWRPEEFATLEGIVVSAPIKIENDRNRTVLGTVEKGDKIIFSYAVIYAYASQPENDTPIYKNLIIHNGEEFWKVDLGEVFCKVGNTVEMITDNVLIEPLEVRGTYDSNGLLRLAEKCEDMGIVKALPPNINLSVRVGDTVCFEPRFVQKYNILGQEHYIIPTRRMLAKAN